jgi:multidrug efflux system membrane fusion protein
MASLLITGCSRGKEKAPPSRGKGMPVPVTVAVAAQKDVPIQLQAIGAAHAYASVSVKPRVDGQLARWGNRRERGDPHTF